MVQDIKYNILQMSI